MKVIIRINRVNAPHEYIQRLKKDILEGLNNTGIAIVPGYCDVFVIEGDTPTKLECRDKHSLYPTHAKEPDNG